MPLTIRSISVLARKINSLREGKRLLRCFYEWKTLQQSMPAPSPAGKKLLIIRLDDIGDYLLFRNQLGVYKRSYRWQRHAITLLGNDSWKDLFTEFDSHAVDDTIWVKKSEYLNSAAYRWETWQGLRAGGFETVIAPARTRPLILDDLCMLAAAPLHALGAVNTYVHPRWNPVSDSLYEELFTPNDAGVHEFQFNAQFASWISGAAYAGRRPTIESPPRRALADAYILCFVGANTRSKRWPAQRWIEFIKLYQARHAGVVILAGRSEAELRIVQAIQARTNAQSIAGQGSLLELLGWVIGAQAVLTNDTMAAHLGASCSRPTVIMANGVNYRRFTEYASSGMTGVRTVYPDVFVRKRRRRGEIAYNYPDAVTADMASIDAATVLAAMEELVPRSS